MMTEAQKQRQRDWRAKNPDRCKEYALHRKKADPNFSLKMSLKKSGWTEALYLVAWENQKGKCALCEVTLDRKKHSGTGAHADHDHSSGKPRKILCSVCNRGLGFFKDNPSLLREAAMYLESDHGS